MLKTHIPFTLTLIFLSCLSPTLRAQVNSEPEHGCFSLEEGRVLALEMNVQEADSNLYITEFLTLKEWSGKQIFIRIPAMDFPYTILVNGFRFGSDPGSGQSREYNITPFLREQSNILALQVEGPVGHYVSKSPVSELLVREAILARDLAVSMLYGATENEILVRFHLFLKSYLEEKNQGRTILLEVGRSGEKKSFRETRDLSTPLSYGQETEMIFDVTVKDPHYWFPGAASYYEAKLTLGDKGKHESEQISFLFPLYSYQLNDSLFIQKGDTVRLVYPSDDLARILPGLPEQEAIDVIEQLGINAIRRGTRLPCELQELFLKTGILPVFNLE